MNQVFEFLNQPRGIVLSIFIAVISLWILSWENPDELELKRRKQTTALQYENTMRHFDFESLIKHTNQYYNLVVKNQSGKKISQETLEALLALFFQERRKYYIHMELVKKKRKKATVRQERSLLHYFESIESIITDLKKRIKQYQNDSIEHQ